MSLTRKIILALFFIGFAGNVGGGGTFASFNASTTNPSAVFSSGSLVLTNQKDSGTLCFSNTTGVTGSAGANTDANANATCDALFSTTLAKPGDTATVDLTLENRGSIGGTLKIYGNSSSCTDSTVGTYSGSGSLCGYLQLKIQAYPTAADRTAGTNPLSSCVYPVSGGSSCGTGTSPSSFMTTHNDYASGADVATLTAYDGNAAPTTGTDTSFLRLTITFPNAGVGVTTDNQYMGRQAAFGFTAMLEQ